MQSATKPPVTSELLTAQAVTTLLRRFQMPFYSALAELMSDWEVYATGVALWRGLWPEKPLPAADDAFAIEYAVLEQIALEMFPIADIVDEMLMSAGEHVLGGPIEPHSWGIAWEQGFNEIAEQYRPLVALTARGLMPADGYEDASILFDETAMEYIEARGLRPLDSDTAVMYANIRRTLEALPAPLNGLAVVYDCLKRDTGNSFFDMVESFWRYEYDDSYDLRGWTVEGVETLAAEYRLSLPKIELLDAYMDWWNTQTDAEAQVLSALQQAFDFAETQDYDPHAAAGRTLVQVFNDETGEDDDGTPLDL